MSMENKRTGIVDDFDRRVTYVAGFNNIREIQRALSLQDLSGEVLELGSGNGTYSLVLARMARRLYATDVCERMVAVCRQKLQHLANVIVEQQDCFGLSYLKQRFDAVVMVNLLHVIADPENALRESHRVFPALMQAAGHFRK